MCLLLERVDSGRHRVEVPMARAGGGGGPCAGLSWECANFSIPNRWGCVCIGVIAWVSRSIDQSVAGGV